LRISKIRGVNMKILLTGKIGIGKTYMCEKIVERAKKKGFTCCGTLTRKLEEGEKNTGLVVEDISTGKKKVLAHRINDGKIRKGIPFCNFIFDENAIEFAKKALSKRGDLLIIDEFGYLELEGKGFNNALLAFKSRRNKNSILVVRNELKEDVSKLLDCDFKVFEVNQKNREGLPEVILTEMFY